MKRGKEKHCEGDKAKLAALEKQQSAALDAQVTATEKTEKLRYERQDQMKADAHNDFIVGIAKFYAGIFGTGAENGYVGFISWANITLMLIIAIAFERLHAFLIEAGRNIKGNIRGLEQRIAHIQSGASFQNEFRPPPNGVPLFRYQEPVKDGGFKETGIGFTAPVGKPATAQSGFVGFKDTNGMQAKTGSDNRPFYGFNDPKKQAALDVLNLADGSEDRKTLDNRTRNKTYRQELASGGKVYRDKALDAPAPTRPANQKAGGTGLQNPALGTAEEHYSLPLEASPKVPEGRQDSHPSRPSAEGIQPLQPKGAEEGAIPKVPEGQQTEKATLTDGLYERWVSAIRAGQCAASVKQSWGWVQKQIAGSQAEKLTFNNREITAVVQLFFVRAIRDGYARLNPKYTSPKCGLPKYQWIA